MTIHVKKTIAQKWMNTFDRIAFDRARKENEAARERIEAKSRGTKVEEKSKK